MTSFTRASLRLLRRLAGMEEVSPPPHPGEPVLLDGITAVALCEARLSQLAALGATFPAAAGARAWHQQALEVTSLLGGQLDTITAPDPAGALAAAMGSTQAGLRSTVFLSGPDLAACLPLLHRAAGQGLPLVVHLASRALAAHGVATGSGDEVCHAIADSGCVVLQARSVQEAVDLTLAARRAAELALRPVVIAMDGAETALAAQEVCLPSEELIRSYVGEPGTQIESTTRAQHLLFGDRRRRVPRWHDLDQPLVQGGLLGPESWGVGQASRSLLLDPPVVTLLDGALRELTSATGRRLELVAGWETDGAIALLLAAGSAVETATAAAIHLRSRERLRVGVLGLTCLRPLPAGELVQLLRGRRAVGVLERAATGLDGEGSLTREIRALLERARENGRVGRTLHAGLPALEDRELPRLACVQLGAGGLPLRARDLVALGRELVADPRPLIHLGLNSGTDRSRYPKRQVLLDQVRREFPVLATRTLRGEAEHPVDLRPAGACTIALHHVGGPEVEGLAGDAAALLHATLGGSVRTRCGMSWQRQGAPRIDRITHSATPLLDPGDDVPVDLAVLAPPRIPGSLSPLEDLAPDGAILCVPAGEGSDLLASLPPGLREQLRGRELHLAPCEPDSPAAARREALLGALLGMLSRRRSLGIKVRQALGERERALSHVPAGHRAALLATFRRAFEEVQVVTVPAHPQAPPAEPGSRPAPPALLERLGRSDRTLPSLPRFWDETGILYRDGATGELSPDPYLATGTTPPLTAALREAETGDPLLPEFDPAASPPPDGSSWSFSPDGSVAAVVLSPRAILEAGMRLAARAGAQVDALRMILPRVNGAVCAWLKQADRAPSTAGEILEAGLQDLLEALGLPPERLVPMREAVTAAVSQLGELPVARTPAFFDAPEAERSGAGELLSVVVNPDTCADAVAAAGAAPGLRLVPRTPTAVDQARRLWRIWEQLPDTSGETMARAAAHPEVGPTAALMLSRACSQALLGADGAPAGSGSRLTVRLLAAACEAELQPRLQAFLARVTELREQILAQVHGALAVGLPDGDLESLGRGLAGSPEDQLELGELLERVGTTDATGQVDLDRLRRLVELGRWLGELQWRLTEGLDGLGRARFSLTLDAGHLTLWAGAFPASPFQVPVAVEPTGHAPELARGLLEGQLEQTLQGLRLVRWAEAELENPQEAAHQMESLGRLTWRDLSREERQLVPPLLLIGEERTLGGQALGGLSWLLASDLPVKVVVLCGAGGEADRGYGVEALDPYPVRGHPELGLLGLVHRRALVLQSSPGAPDHLLQGLRQAIAFPGPALCCVHAPEPARHGFAPESTMQQARLAVRTRAFPLFSFDPSRGGVFGTCLSLEGNPEPGALLPEEGLSPADWAWTEDRFRECFTPLADQDAAARPIREWLELTPQERQGITPFLRLPGEEDVRLAIAPDLAGEVAARVHLWATLQELAGLVTPFTDQVHAEAEAAVAGSRARELAELQAQHEQQLAELQQRFNEDAVHRIRRQLLALAGSRAPDRAPEGNGEA